MRRWFDWIAIPHIGLLIVTLQALGYIACYWVNPEWAGILALFPQRVLEGEYWRLVTFLSMPLSNSVLWTALVLMFLYMILESIESAWGPFKTTLYVLTAWAGMVLFSFAFGYPILQVRHFESTLFLAAATLFPEQEVRVYFMIPVKMKWLALMSAAFVGWEFYQGSWLERGFLLMIYANFILFFSPALLGRLQQYQRNRKFRAQMNR